MTQTAISRLSMVILMQPDLDAAVAFYHELGLPMKFRMKNTWAEFELNGIKIGLCQSTTPAQQNRTGLVFEVADLTAFHDAKKEAITFLNAPIEAAHGVMTSIQDPGGNIIDIYQPTPEKIAKILAEKANQPEPDACCKPEPVSCCKSC